MTKFKMNTKDIHELIALSAALNFQLRQAEGTRKRIAELSLREKRKYVKS